MKRKPKRENKASKEKWYAITIISVVTFSIFTGILWYNLALEKGNEINNLLQPYFESKGFTVHYESWGIDLFRDVEWRYHITWTGNNTIAKQVLNSTYCWEQGIIENTSLYFFTLFLRHGPFLIGIYTPKGVYYDRVLHCYYAWYSKSVYEGYGLTDPNIKWSTRDKYQVLFIN